MAKDIATISDMMRALEEEIEAVKNGTIQESAARVVLRGRALQLQAASLNIQYQRLISRNKPSNELKLITSPQKEEEKKENLT
jgi:hypothetical protein